MDVLKIMRQWIPARIRHAVRWIADAGYRHRRQEKKRLQAMPRYVATETDLVDGQPFRLVDAASFLSAYRHIFQEEIYAFESERSDPLIIDAGANVGQAVVYWKQRYPAARIRAFEPDPDVFHALEWNCAQRGYDQADLHRAAVWVHDRGVVFRTEGADGGSIAEGADASSNDVSTVPTVRLRDYLSEPVDLLKLDIEGAETDVLLDCTGVLDRVQHLFVEYHSFVDQEQRVSTLLGVLQDAGFRLHIHPEFMAAHPFIERRHHAGMDHRLNIFAYRP